MESNPNFSAVLDEDLFVVRWHAATVPSVEQLTARLESRRAELGRSLYYIALISADTPQPDEQTRSTMLESIDKTYPSMSKIRAVILGTGFKATFVRSTMTAMTLIAGMRGQHVKVEKTARQAIEHYAQHSGRSAQLVLERLVREGILSGDELG